MFHSEYGQDKFVAELLGHKRNGTFVEFGALDGLLHSNSLYFERELGWTGLLIEANPDAYRVLVENRWNTPSACVAIYDKVGVAKFHKIKTGLYGWSGLADEIEPEHWDRMSRTVMVPDQEVIDVRCMPLDDMLRRWEKLLGPRRVVDYMSIDVEGAEEKILSVFPFADFNIDVLGVEDNFGNARLDEIIRAGGYQFLQKCGPDRMYRKILT